MCESSMYGGVSLASHGRGASGPRVATGGPVLQEATSESGHDDSVTASRRRNLSTRMRQRRFGFNEPSRHRGTSALAG